MNLDYNKALADIHSLRGRITEPELQKNDDGAVLKGFISNTERAMAAEDERRTLLSQAMRHHISNVSSELRRYEAELDHINAVCDDRMS